MAVDEETFALIKEVVENLDERTTECQKYRKYFDGDHELGFATEKWQNAFGNILKGIRDNVCPIVVESMVDRLQIKGFGIEGSSGETQVLAPEQMAEPTVPVQMDPDAPADEPPDLATEPDEPDTDRDPHAKDRALIDSIWKRNRMDAGQDEIHEEAAKCGEAYVLVWHNDEGEAVIYPNDADSIYCKYQEESKTELRWAAKRWTTDDDRIRLNLYYPDRTEKYVTTESSKGNQGKATNWEPYVVVVEGTEDEPEFEEEWPLPNPYEQVPVFRFKNGTSCTSELKNVIPIQDALNKSVADMLVGGEFQAFPQRLITGLEEPRNEEGETMELPFRPGSDRLWTLWGEAIKAQQFDAADLTQFLAQQNDLRTEAGRVSRTPPHLMMLITSDIPSGKSLTVLEVPFLAKIRRRHKSWGNDWEDVMSFCVRVETGQELKVTLSSEWAPAELEDPKEQAETLTLWQAMGVPEEVIWEKLGFTQEEIARMRKIKKAQPNPLAQVEGMMDQMAQNGQPPRGQTPPALAPFARMTSEATREPPS